MIGYQKVKKFSRFDTTHDHDGQIDGQTDTASWGRSR